MATTHTRTCRGYFFVLCYLGITNKSTSAANGHVWRLLRAVALSLYSRCCHFAVVTPIADWLNVQILQTLTMRKVTLFTDVATNIRGHHPMEPYLLPTIQGSKRPTLTPTYANCALSPNTRSSLCRPSAWGRTRGLLTSASLMTYLSSSIEFSV